MATATTTGIMREELSRKPEIIKGKSEMREWTRRNRSKGKTIGLVPTMGYLHEGHLSLVKHSQKQADLTVVSIYVNPAQFSPNEDLSSYPSNLLSDIHKLSSLNVDVIFNPDNLYDNTNSDNNDNVGVRSCLESASSHETWVRVERLEKGLCGNSRPVFFRGVATVVSKLFNIVDPDFAFFGKKDYQQLRVIQRMVRDLDFAVQVIGCEIVRDDDGLAMSSRNVHLSPEDRQKALSINRSLSKAKGTVKDGKVDCREIRDSVIQAIEDAGGKVDYAEIVDQDNLEPVGEIKRPVVFCVAAWFGKVRLIDNMEMNI